MRIGIDARELCGHPTGVGRYLAGMLRQWRDAAEARRHTFLLYSHQPLTGVDASHVSQRPVGGNGGTRWEQITLPRALAADRTDVLFAPGYTAPYFAGIPVVVAIHDVSFAAHPEWFSWRQGLRRRTLTRAAARRARAVITISNFSRDEIVRHFGIDASKIKVIPPGIDHPPAASSQEPGASLQPPAPSPRVLYVGSIFNRRHVPDLIAAVDQVSARHPGVELDLVGDNRSFPRQDIQAAVAGARHAKVRWHEYVSDMQLEQLYAAATGFAFLSEYEGLGLTPLEALARGVPPVLLDTPVARESCGSAALYAPTPDPGAIAAAISQLLCDQPTRARLLAAAPAVLARYDWTNAAADTLRVVTGVA